MVAFFLAATADQRSQGGQLVGSERAGHLLRLDILRVGGIEMDTHVPVKSVQTCGRKEGQHGGGGGGGIAGVDTAMSRIQTQTIRDSEKYQN
jgi:hypothetical protein